MEKFTIIKSVIVFGDETVWFHPITATTTQALVDHTREYSRNVTPFGNESTKQFCRKQVNWFVACLSRLTSPSKHSIMRTYKAITRYSQDTPICEERKCFESNPDQCRVASLISK